MRRARLCTCADNIKGWTKFTRNSNSNKKQKQPRIQFIHDQQNINGIKKYPKLYQKKKKYPK